MWYLAVALTTVAIALGYMLNARAYKKEMRYVCKLRAGINRTNWLRSYEKQIIRCYILAVIWLAFGLTTAVAGGFL